MLNVEKYEEVERFQSQTILDTLINKYLFGNHILIWKDVSWAINQIQHSCLGFTIKANVHKKIRNYCGLEIRHGSVVSLS